MVKKDYKLLEFRHQSEKPMCLPVSWKIKDTSDDVPDVVYLGLHVTSPKCTSTSSSRSHSPDDSIRIKTEATQSETGIKIHSKWRLLPFPIGTGKGATAKYNDITGNWKEDVASAVDNSERKANDLDAKRVDCAKFITESPMVDHMSVTVDESTTLEDEDNPRLSDWSTTHLTSDGTAKIGLVSTSKAKLSRFRTELKLNEATPRKDTVTNISTDTFDSFVSAEESLIHNTTTESVNISDSDSSQEGSPLNLRDIYRAYRQKCIRKRSQLNGATKTTSDHAKRGMCYNVRDQTIVSIGESASSIERASDSGVDMETEQVDQNRKGDTLDSQISESFNLKKYVIGKLEDDKAKLSRKDKPFCSAKEANLSEAQSSNETDQSVAYPLDHLFQKRQKERSKKKFNFKLTNIIVCGCSKSQSVTRLTKISAKPAIAK